MTKLIVHSADRAPTANGARPSVRAAPPEAAPQADPNAFEDSQGRVIRVRKLTALQMMRLMRDVGEENDRYFGFCTDVASVSEINGRSFSFPETRIELEHIVQLLEIDGVTALRTHLHPKKEPDDTTSSDQ